MPIQSVHKNLDRAALTALQSKLSGELGMSLAGDTGSAEAHGVTISWVYDETAATLTLNCIKKPFYVPASLIQQHLDALA